MWLSERLSHLPWVKASMWQTDLNSGGSSSQADLFNKPFSLEIEDWVFILHVFTKAEEGKGDFPAEQTYPVWTNNPSMTKSYLTFQGSFASPFYVPFTKTLQIKFWSLPTSHYHLLRTWSPDFSGTSQAGPGSFLRPTAHDSLWRLRSFGEQ